MSAADISESPFPQKGAIVVSYLRKGLHGVVYLTVYSKNLGIRNHQQKIFQNLHCHVQMDNKQNQYPMGIVQELKALRLYLVFGDSFKLSSCALP